MHKQQGKRKKEKKKKNVHPREISYIGDKGKCEWGGRGRGVADGAR